MHSGHMSKIFRELNGTSGKLHWREVGELERVCASTAHPIAAGMSTRHPLRGDVASLYDRR